MKKNYDRKIRDHYDTIAAELGNSSLSTMLDETVRRMETKIIVDFVRDASNEKTNRLMDAGCGNGYTLSVLADQFPDHRLTGVELNPSLRRIASARFRGKDAAVLAGDVRRKGFHGDEPFGLLICQRVLINILDLDDQRAALDNMIAAVRPAGVMLFIESFQAGLDRLNEARSEFDLPPLDAAFHNLYLPEDFFTGLTPYESASWSVSPSHFSTHYFVTRVLHAAASRGKPLKRNSEFVKFFAAALPSGIGDYAPSRVHAFVRD